MTSTTVSPDRGQEAAAAPQPAPTVPIEPVDVFEAVQRIARPLATLERSALEIEGGQVDVARFAGRGLRVIEALHEASGLVGVTKLENQLFQVEATLAAISAAAILAHSDRGSVEGVDRDVILDPDAYVSAVYMLATGLGDRFATDRLEDFERECEEVHHG